MPNHSPSLLAIDLLIRHRRRCAEFLSLAIACAALAGGFLLRFEFAVPHFYLTLLANALGWSVAIKFLVFRLFGLRHVGWRHVGFRDLIRIAAAHCVGSVTFSSFVWWMIGAKWPRSLYVLDLLLCLCLEISTRGIIRVLLGTPAILSSGRRRILIFGAGEAGVLLLKDLGNDPGQRYDVVGLLDDDPHKQGMRVHGVQVLGTRREIRLVAARLSVEEVWIALPQVDGSNLAGILEECQAAQIVAKRVPAVAEIVDGRVLLDQVRDVRIEDLLGRPPAVLYSKEVPAHLQGKVILVTGAGGSIGSELCRQIARHGPAQLIGLDQAETALYEIEAELHAQHPQQCFWPEIGSIQNYERLNEVFSRHRPDIVFHAAAYKHVPLMEAHIFEALRNNVFGTRNVVQCSAQWGIQEFVMISSDKAVRPTNVMGATKRVSELICMAESSRPRWGGLRMKTVAVRFGNVLGSNGSVIPRFRQQIAKGGPVTVTHPEIERYFMTIPEAAQLVLQAAVLGTRDGIFVLEMGKPVRILDLAHKMIHLSGLRPGKDIRIEFCGLRPGEKMYEELTGYQENTAPTRNSQIRVLLGPIPDLATLDLRLQLLQEALQAADLAHAVHLLQQLVPDYIPSQHLARPPVRELTQSAPA